jgi:hypothetical protein
VACSLRDTLELERTQAVRAAVVACVPLTDETLEAVLERTLDASFEVRAAVYRRLQQYAASAVRWEGPGMIRGGGRGDLLR